MVAVTINVDSSNLGTTVEQVFAQLSDADKKELARSVMLEVLTKPHQSERLAEEARLADWLVEKHQNDVYQYDRITTVAQARQHRKFSEHMGKWRSSSERMLQMITDSAITHFKEQVTELVKNDDQLKARYDVVQKELIQAYPSMVQCAMTSFFAGQMQQIGFSIQNSDMMKGHLQVLGSSIQDQLANNGLHIQVPQVF